MNKKQVNRRPAPFSYKKAALGSIVLLAAAAILISFYLLYARSGYFIVEKVVLAGQRKGSSVDCGEIENKIIGRNIFELPLKHIRDNALESYPELRSLRLDRAGFFRRAGIGWIGPEACPRDVQTMHEQLGNLLAACGYRQDGRPYLPHLSLFRRCTRPLAPDQPFRIDWPVSDFGLFESVPTRDGVVYRELCNYPL